MPRSLERGTVILSDLTDGTLVTTALQSFEIIFLNKHFILLCKTPFLMMCFLVLNIGPYIRYH